MGRLERSPPIVTFSTTRPVTGDSARTMAFRDFCARRGAFGSVFCPPATAEGRAYLRFTVNCGLSDEQCDRFLQVMEDGRAVLFDKAKFDAQILRDRQAREERELSAAQRKLVANKDFMKSHVVRGGSADSVNRARVSGYIHSAAKDAKERGRT